MTSNTQWENLNIFDQEWSGQPGQHLIHVPNGDSICITVSDAVGKSKLDVIVISFMGAVSNPGRIDVHNFMVNHSLNKNLPVIHVTDPLVQYSDSMKLAWYVGHDNDAFTDELISALKSVQRKMGKELLFVGGNGGGLAALELARRFKGPCSVITWDAHTDIYEAPQSLVKPFLKYLFNFSNTLLQSNSWKSHCKKRTFGRIVTNVNSDETLSSPRRILFLQNSSHGKPLIHAELLWRHSGQPSLSEGQNSIDENRGFILNEYSDMDAGQYMHDINEYIGMFSDKKYKPFAI
ncbi:hypothetical protein [Glutamicibacter ardleyensis]|uniref:hypothetical protein n=1 Tax=Glutamicibacter ardleyensis TaxID=225894 RepID=UPI003FD49213